MNFITKIDLSILNFIQDTLKSGFMDKMMTSITALGNMGIFWLLLIIVFLSSKEYKKLAKIMIVSLIINTVLVNIIIKPIVGRVRPFELVDGIKLLVLKPTDPSFPSGHSAISFCMMTVIVLFSKSKSLNIMAIVLAFLIAFSRLYLYVHYPTDVIVGALLGVLTAVLGSKFYYSSYGKDLRKKLKTLKEDISYFNNM